MPEKDDVEVTINENALKVDVMHSSGSGGQSVNTTRITLTLYRLEEIMQGSFMDDIVEPLIADEQALLMEQNRL